MPEICIIIPVYNAESYIDRCLESVLKQTFQDFQVLLVNDGSQDASLELCRRFAEEDSRFVIIDKKNGGAASARNAGLDWYHTNSTSPWLCFLDIDDFIHERYLEILLHAAKSTGASISMCSYVTTAENELPALPAFCAPVLVDMEEIWCERQINCTIPWAKLFFRDAFREVRFPEGIIHEDEFALYLVLFQQKEIAFVNLPLYGYYQTEQSVMRGEWTPRHMTEPEGILCQLNYFREHQYPKAERYAARMYLFSLYRNWNGAKSAGEAGRDCAEQLYRDLRRGLLRMGKTAGLSFKNESWLFYAAFPIATAPFRLMHRVFGDKQR